MMNNVDDGGPAFPCPTGTDGGSLFDGMSLRDWFAGQVLVATSALTDAFDDVHDLAKNAYHVADAMLAARKS